MTHKRTSRLTWLALPMAVVLAACGTNQGGGGGRAAQSPAAGGPASPAQLTGELNVWAMGNEGTLLGKFAQKFAQENPGVTVKVTPVDWGVAHDKLLTAIGGNQTPDVSQMGTDMMGEFAKTGALEQVPGNIDKSRFFDSAWNTGVTQDCNA